MAGDQSHRSSPKQFWNLLGDSFCGNVSHYKIHPHFTPSDSLLNDFQDKYFEVGEGASGGLSPSRPYGRFRQKLPFFNGFPCLQF